MGETITISLSEDIKAEGEAFTREHGLSWNELVQQALREYVLIRRSRELRARMVPHAQAQGIFTDEDVFKRVS